MRSIQQNINTNIIYEELLELNEELKLDIIKLVPLETYFNILNSSNKYMQNIDEDRIINNNLKQDEIFSFFLNQFEKGDNNTVKVVTTELHSVIVKITNEIKEKNIDFLANDKKVIEENAKIIIDIFNNNILDRIQTTSSYNYIKIFLIITNIHTSNELDDCIYNMIISQKLINNKEKVIDKGRIKNQSNDNIRIEFLEKEIEKLKIINYNLSVEKNQLESHNDFFTSRFEELNIQYDNKTKYIKNESEKKYNRYEEEINILKDKIRELNKENIYLKDEVNRKKEKVYEVVKSEWIRNNQEKIIEIAEKEDQLTKLDKELQKLNEQFDSFTENIQSKVFDAYLQKSILDRVLLNDVSEKVDKNSEVLSIFQIKGTKFESNADEVKHIKHFVSDISDNFEVSGINSGLYGQYDLANILVSTLSLRDTGILLCGEGSRDLVNGYSYAYSSESAHIITLPSGYNNINEIFHLIQNSDNQVILIENYQAGINDNLILSLLKSKCDKVLFFSIENEEDIKYIPKFIFNWFMLIKTDLNYKEDVIIEYEYNLGYGKKYLKSYSPKLENNMIEENNSYLDLINELGLSELAKNKLVIILTNCTRINNFINKYKEDDFNREYFDKILCWYLTEEYMLIENDEEKLKRLVKKIDSLNSSYEEYEFIMNKFKARFD